MPCALPPPKFGNWLGRLGGPRAACPGWEDTASCEASGSQRPRPCSCPRCCVIPLFHFPPALSSPLALLHQQLPCLGSLWVILRAGPTWTLLEEPPALAFSAAEESLSTLVSCSGFSDFLLLQCQAKLFPWSSFEYFFGVHGCVLHFYLSSCLPWHGAYVFDKFISVLPGFLLLQSLVYLFFTIRSSGLDVSSQ